ncbi:MAG: efflux RND transporter periplasmic adaptor subunit [Bryobacteraceae bacterium]
MKGRAIVIVPALILVAALLGWAGVNLFRAASAPVPDSIPTARVRRGDVEFTVTAKGEMQGGNSQMLTAPMVGGAELIITKLRRPGELVQKNEVVVEFDTTEQIYKLREAEADLAEAEQKVLQAKAEGEARQEEDRFALIKAKADLTLAELDARRNPLLAAITARQNELAVEAARTQLEQLQKDLGAKKDSSLASIRIQEAALNKAKVLAAVAQKNIDSMTLKAASCGYVSVQQNVSGNFFFMGMQFPLYQVGDIVRPGMAVAQIPDLDNWEVQARIGELDRGHLAEGQAAEVKVVALPGKAYKARVRNMGGTYGPPWDRRFECKLGLEDPTRELRPGMTVGLTVKTGVLSNVLWVPAQALFESDSRTFVYVRHGSGFSPLDVKLVRRGESKVVVTGVGEGLEVALAAPDQQKQEQKPANGQGIPGKG